jgi:UDPglucose 6-dehydrogenase
MFKVFLLFFVFAGLQGHESKKIAVLGTGYVGLVLGTCLSEWGHDVICVDIQKERIEKLQNKEIPFYEPGLKELVAGNISASRLAFTTDISDAIQRSEVIFVTVGTPTLEDGSADISALISAADQIGKNLTDKKVVCIRSTVPVGTTRSIARLIALESDAFEIAFCPEFLREGTAVEDFFHSDRFVIGVETPHARKILTEIFLNEFNAGTPSLETNLETAETIKYASNAFLATKITFINEMSNFCQKTGADIESVSRGMGLDKRIGPDFLKPGPGYGGSCFPKDTLALLSQGKDHAVSFKVVEATVEANTAQKLRMVEKLEMLAGSLNGKRIAILGLAFKANTDDVRESPSITVIEEILKRGAIVKAYDPMASSNMKRIFPDLVYGKSVQEALQDADAAVVMNDWDEFKKLDPTIFLEKMKNPILLDTRNIYSPSLFKAYGIHFDNVGRL